MKSLFLSSLAVVPVLALIVGSCAQDDTTTGTGGLGVAGDTGAGGNSSNPTTTGASGTDGTSGSVNPTTGASGSGNVAGSTGEGGAAGGAGGAGGSAGGAGGAGGTMMAGAVTVDSITGVKNKFMDAFKDSYFLFPCYSNAAQDCITAVGACPNQNAMLYGERGLQIHEYFSVGGTPGKNYKVTIKVAGLAEAKYYEKGTRAAGNADPANPQGDMGTDTFYTGGDPIDQEFYNVYEIRVRQAPAAGGADGSGALVQNYYLNSFPKANRAYEDHETFFLNYTHDIVVPGGGQVEYHSGDSNCHAIDNCGPGFHGATCQLTDGRTITFDPGLKVPDNYLGQPVTTLNLRTGASQPFHSQIIHVTVTAVTEM